MAHHNFELSDELSKLFKDAGQPEGIDEARDRLREELESIRLGATGQYPNGQYGKHDEGEIRFAVAADKARGVVLIDFGKPIHSLGITHEQAAELADLLRAKAWECRGIDPS